MKKNELYVYTALSLATLVPVPGWLAYGIVIIVMLSRIIQLSNIR